MVLPTDIKKANQSKADDKVETGNQKQRSFNRGVDSSRKNVLTAQQPEASREKNQASRDNKSKDTGSKRGSSSSKTSRSSSKSQSQSAPQSNDEGKETWACYKTQPKEEQVVEQRPVAQKKCYFNLPRMKRTCANVSTNWQHCEYVRDECGSGIVPKRFAVSGKQRWCGTPLSMYQATIGEVGRQLLCGETVINREINSGPPCNIDEYIMPACAGYYRKYDCLKPCEERHVKIKGGKKVYRDRVERYWNPCVVTPQETVKVDINDFAPHNAVLAAKFRRNNIDGDEKIPCW